MQHDAHGAAGAIRGVAFAQPHDGGAVSFRFRGEVYRHEGGRPVMEGPVEFQSAGNPQPVSTDQRGLDDVLPIEKIIMVHLVIGFKDTPAQRGNQNQT